MVLHEVVVGIGTTHLVRCLPFRPFSGTGSFVAIVEEVYQLIFIFIFILPGVGIFQMLDILVLLHLIIITQSNCTPPACPLY